MSEFAIRAERLGKRYRLGLSQTAGRKSLVTALAGQFSYLSSTLRDPTADEVIWAVKDVSFEVRPGEVLGLIGANGAGKSTLLKILSRITRPTEGKAWLNGRVGSLLEVGTGFHQELTGRENVYLSGAILGMPRAETERKFDEIVDFSGVEKFIDMPIKRYSSGMKVRLGFAVAAHLEPEILLVDEVLSVGDMNFQEKALGKVRNVVGGGRTVVFVSHYMTAISQLCERVILMRNGSIYLDGPANEAIACYLGLSTESQSRSENLADYRRTDGAHPIFDVVRFCGKPLPGSVVLPPRSGFLAEIAGDTRGRKFTNFRASLHFQSEEGIRVLSTATAWSSVGYFDAEGPIRMRCEMEELPLLPGRYLVTVEANSGRQSLDLLENVGMVVIQPTYDANTAATPKRKQDGYFWTDGRWEVEQETNGTG